MAKNPIKEPVKQVRENIPTTSRKRFYQRKYIFQSVLILLLIGFAVLTFFAKVDHYFEFDVVITHYIQSLRSPWLDNFMQMVSYAGNPGIGPIVTVLVTLLVWVLFSRKDALFLLGSSVGISIIGQVVKLYVSRPRPDPTLIFQYSKFIRPDSFPSGHVLFFMGIFGFLMFIIFTKVQKNIYQKVIIILLILLVVLIGISRIYLGAHWFSDTLGSYLLGVSWLMVMIYLYGKIFPNPKVPS